MLQSYGGVLLLQIKCTALNKTCILTYATAQEPQLHRKSKNLFSGRLWSEYFPSGCSGLGSFPKTNTRKTDYNSDLYSTKHALHYQTLKKENVLVQSDLPMSTFGKNTLVNMKWEILCQHHNLNRSESLLHKDSSKSYGWNIQQQQNPLFLLRSLSTAVTNWKTCRGSGRT